MWDFLMQLQYELLVLFLIVVLGLTLVLVASAAINKHRAKPGEPRDKGDDDELE